MGTSSRPELVAELNAATDRPHAALQLVTEIPFGDHTLARYRMENGLTLLLLEDHSAPVVSYHTWFRVGSRHETPGKTGLAHLFEHLMFNETEHLPAGEFDRKLEAAGGEVNAATWVDWTFYYENIPSTELPLVVELEADRMAHLVLRDPQVDSEKEVVANERRYRVEDDVEGSVNELLYKTAFEKHPYHWPTIGWMQDIQGFTTQDCERFYATYYAPNNAVLVVVGDFQERELLSMLQAHYGERPAAQLPVQHVPSEPDQQGERRLEIHKPTPTDKLQLGYRGPALAEADHDALTIANEILFGGRSSRLYRALVSEGELASEARAGLMPFADPGLYEVWVSMREGHRAEEALEVVEAQLAQLAQGGVPQAELDKAKNRMELGFLQAMETAGGKAEQIGFYETTLGDAAEVFGRLEAYRAVRAEDVQRVVQTLTAQRRTTLFVRPTAQAGSPA